MFGTRPPAAVPFSHAGTTRWARCGDGSRRSSSVALERATDRPAAPSDQTSPAQRGDRLEPGLPHRTTRDQHRHTMTCGSENSLRNGAPISGFVRLAVIGHELVGPVGDDRDREGVIRGRPQRELRQRSGNAQGRGRYAGVISPPAACETTRITRGRSRTRPGAAPLGLGLVLCRADRIASRTRKPREQEPSTCAYGETSIAISARFRSTMFEPASC